LRIVPSTAHYDFVSGLPTSVTDPNGRTASTSYTNQLLGTGAVDPFGRPGLVTDPQGRTTVMRYFDTARKSEVWSDLNSPSDAKLRTRTSSDQLGRGTCQRALKSDPPTSMKTDPPGGGQSEAR